MKLLFSLTLILVLLKLDIEGYVLLLSLLNIGPHLSLMHFLLRPCRILKTLFFILCVWIKITNKRILAILVSQKFQRFDHSENTKLLTQSFFCPRVRDEFYVEVVAVVRRRWCRVYLVSQSEDLTVGASLDGGLGRGIVLKGYVTNAF